MYRLNQNFVLASQSQSRCQLLKTVGLEFEVIPSDVEEKQRPNETPEEYVARNAYEKGFAVASKDFFQPTIVLSADTLAFDDQLTVYEKPKTIESCQSMLRSFSGRTHSVVTSYALFQSEDHPELIIQENVQALVSFRQLSESEIQTYPKFYPQFDCVAGGYSLQNTSPAIAFLEKIEGDFYTVIGLPIGRILNVLLKNRICYPSS
jgi:septum formation protein